MQSLESTRAIPKGCWAPTWRQHRPEAAVLSMHHKCHFWSQWWFTSGLLGRKKKEIKSIFRICPTHTLTSSAGLCLKSVTTQLRMIFLLRGLRANCETETRCICLRSNQMLKWNRFFLKFPNISKPAVCLGFSTQAEFLRKTFNP